jgi:hypothetical protein
VTKTRDVPDKERSFISIPVKCEKYPMYPNTMNAERIPLKILAMIRKKEADDALMDWEAIEANVKAIPDPILFWKKDWLSAACQTYGLSSLPKSGTNI